VDSTRKFILIAALLSPITYPVGLVKGLWGRLFPKQPEGMPSEKEIHREEEKH